MKLPDSLRWIEIDLPDMVRAKHEALAADQPVCRLERVSADLADTGARRDLFARIAADSRDVLVLAEGLLVYLAPETVGALADDLSGQPSLRHWAIDLATPMIKKRVERWWGKRLKEANTKYQFAPDEGTGFFESHGWREAEFHALFTESIRLNRTMSGMWMYHVMERITPRHAARMLQKWRAGVVLLERK
jgi:O-methyltransferase involved in polyketide biosynthesis